MSRTFSDQPSDRNFQTFEEIISFALLALNLGFSNEFAVAWLCSWAIGYVIVFPQSC